MRQVGLCIVGEDRRRESLLSLPGGRGRNTNTNSQMSGGDGENGRAVNKGAMSESSR